MRPCRTCCTVASFVTSEDCHDEQFILELHDQPQDVTIRITPHDSPATVRLQSTGLRIFERMAQIRERNAASLHQSHA